MSLHSGRASLFLMAMIAMLSFVLLMPQGIYAGQSEVIDSPDWSPGDTWMLEQSKRQLGAPDAGWGQPLRWRVEVKVSPRSNDRLVLQVRPESGSDNQASALGRLATAKSPGAAPDTGVDVEFTANPWQVHLVRTRVATAHGVKTIDYEVESSGPVLMHTAPFDLVLPSFPLQGSSSSTLQSLSSSAGAPLATGAEPLEDSSAGGPRLGQVVTAHQQVGAIRVGDPLAARAESAAASLSGRTLSFDVNSGRLVQTKNGRSTARQLWVEGLPWALAEETAYSKTSLVELK